MSDAALVQLSRAQQALAECKTAMEAKHIADVAEAARVYLERTNASVDTVNNAIEIRGLAERQMGEFLKQMPKATGTRMAGRDEAGASVVVQSDRRETLREIGITKDQSSRAQKLAAIPEPEFRERIAAIKASGEKLSTAKVLNFGNPNPADMTPAEATPVATEAPVIDIPRRRFHPSPKFTMSAWCESTRTLLGMRFSAVPEEHMTAAAEAVAQMAKAFLSENQTK